MPKWFYEDASLWVEVFCSSKTDFVVNCDILVSYVRVTEKNGKPMFKVTFLDGGVYNLFVSFEI